MMISRRLIDNADSAAALLAVLGNAKRLAIMAHLLNGELSVGVIAERVSLSQSALSQHLAKLRGLDLVETRRDRQMIYYSCKSERARHLMAMLDRMYGGNPHERFAEGALRSTGAAKPGLS